MLAGRAGTRTALYGTLVCVSGSHPNYRAAASLPAELRRTTVPEAVRRWVERETGRRVLRWRRLPGASTSAVHAVRLSDDSIAVLRRWVWPWVLLDEPEVAQRELDALDVASSAGLAAPRVIAADSTGEHVGDGVPVLLMTKLAGSPVDRPDPHRLAETAAKIHAVDAPELRYEFFRWCMDALTEPPPGASDPLLWERALELRKTAMPDYTAGFIHRDYNPGNVLWLRGRVSGVVDWALACRGPWECDIATCRANLLRLLGPAAADRFLDAYTSLTGRVFNPYWDLNYLLENDAEHWTNATVRRSEPFLRRILTELDTMR